MKREEILQRMESLNSEIENLRNQDVAEDQKPIIEKMIEGKTAEFDGLAEDAKKLDEADSRKAAMEALKAKSDKLVDVKAPEVTVPDSEHNQGNKERLHGKAFLEYTTNEKSAAHGKAAFAREHGDNLLNEVSTKEGMKMPRWMADFVAPKATGVEQLENAMGKSAEEVFGKAIVLVRQASGTGSGGGSSVNVDFEPTLFKTPKRNNAIPGKCWVKRAVGKECQYPKLTQSSNQYGVVAAWGNAGATGGEGTSISQSDPVQTRIDVNLERLSLLSAVSKRYLRNNDVNFLSELAWMYRGTVDFQLGRAILEGVEGSTLAPIGINTNASITNGVAVQARQTASQVSYTDLVRMQFAVDDGIFGTGEYVISATSTGAMRYICSLDDTAGRPIFGGDSQSGWGVSNAPSIAGAPYVSAKENSKALGARGDVIYGNFMGYGLAVDGDEMAIERSDEYAFNTGQITFRLIMYAGGTPLGYDMFSVLGDVSGASSSSSSSS